MKYPPFYGGIFIRLFGDFSGIKNESPHRYAGFRAIGGGGGNRTLVRKALDRTFSGCRAPIKFPSSAAGARAGRIGSFFVYDRFKSKRAVHLYHYMTLEPKPWSSMVKRAAVWAAAQRYATSATLSLAFNFKFGLFKRFPPSTRLSCLKLPVETFTPPCLESNRRGEPYA